MSQVQLEMSVLGIKEPVKSLYLGLISVQSFTVVSNLTVKVSQLLCQAHGLMRIQPFALILPQLFL